ncbi:MAG: hypothetical protein IH831_04715 [Planctomycetes bacterium]|nr:hypothetical protein [Planctomycetota bacterium]
MSSQEPTGALEVLDEAGRGVRVEFHKSGDRLRHVILAIHGEKRFPVLTSFEGNLGQVLPHIPCFLEFHQQGQTLFLTGASSVGHWSMSLQIAEAPFPEEGEHGCRAATQLLSFDVACRLKESGHHVGSEYFLAENFDSHLDGVGKTALVADLAGDAPGLQLLGADPFSSSVSHADGANLRLFSPDKLPEKLPATVQWRYAVSVTR